MRLMIVCDQPSVTRRLCSELSNCPAEIIRVANLLELKVACESPFDLALINVAWTELVECIHTIRESPSGRHCAVLVAAECLSNERGRTGILPILRAMPCPHRDMVKLAHRLMIGRQEKERRWNRRTL